MSPVLVFVASYVVIGLAFLWSLCIAARIGDEQNESAYEQWRAEQ